MIAIGSRRTCRTCPAVISEHGDTGQCRACQDRSTAVRAAVAPEQRTGARKRSCEVDGHHGCLHFVALMRSFQDFVADCDVCAACGAEGDGSGKVDHPPQCPLLVLLIAEREAIS